VSVETAVVEPWPHQLRAYKRMLDSWPFRLLIADEVGLGKTIEAGMIIRHAWISGMAPRVLIMTPAGVLKQWQNELYEKFPDKGHFKGQFDVYAKRNTVILGLIVYQGLNTGSLEKLEVKNLDLEKGIIHIPATDHKLNPRKLPLEAVQILPLKAYLEKTRPQLLELTTANKDNQKLFPKSEKTEFSSVTGSILKRLKKQTEITSLYQIRISRIALWLQQYNLREVQYKAGYKSLQSLEAFDRDALEELKEAVEKYHPF